MLNNGDYPTQQVVVDDEEADDDNIEIEEDDEPSNDDTLLERFEVAGGPVDPLIKFEKVTRVLFGDKQTSKKHPLIKVIRTELKTPNKKNIPSD